MFGLLRSNGVKIFNVNLARENFFAGVGAGSMSALILSAIGIGVGVNLVLHPFSIHATAEFIGICVISVSALMIAGGVGWFLLGLVDVDLRDSSKYARHRFSPGMAVLPFVPAAGVMAGAALFLVLVVSTIYLTHRAFGRFGGRSISST
jgi:hypothetical protein